MKKMFNKFKAFIARGNVMDMAVGVIVATAFGKITTSLVNDVFMPFISWIFGTRDMSALNLVAGLGLHFRTVKLAAGDCSASMARTYDIEILIPSMNGYKEVSSVSNARDFQARRGNIRYRRADGKIDFVHTLNGSGLATSRIFPAIVEQNQRADGSIVVPEVLRKYLGGLEIISK